MVTISPSIRTRGPMLLFVCVWMATACAVAGASLPLYFTPDEAITQLLDSLAVQGLLPIDVRSVRHHDRQWLIHKLQEVQTTGTPPTPVERTQVDDLRQLLRFELATARIRASEPETDAALNFHSSLTSQQNLDPVDNATRLMVAGQLLGESGALGFFIEAGWGLLSDARGYELDPREQLFGGKSWSFLPQQVWLVPQGYLSIGTPTCLRR